MAEAVLRGFLSGRVSLKKTAGSYRALARFGMTSSNLRIIVHE